MERLKKIVKIVNSCYLCIRFPFLYPRNRFTGKHYNNRKLLDKAEGIYNIWYDYSRTHQEEYYRKFGSKAINLFGEKVQIYTLEVLKRSWIYPEYVIRIAPISDRIRYLYYNFANDFLGIFHCVPTYTELDAVPYGWRKRLGIDFCKELKRQTIKDYGRKWFRKHLRITDVKEEDELYVGITSGSPGMYRVINKYGYLSQFVCRDCGEDADKVSIGYYNIPFCDKCLPTGDWKWIEKIYDWEHPDRIEENKKMHGDE